MHIRWVMALAMVILLLFSCAAISSAEEDPSSEAVAQEESDGGGAGTAEPEEPSQPIRGKSYNPRRLRFGIEVTANIGVKPLTYKGPCPAVFTLTGHISANKPTVVDYKIVRKDATFKKPATLTFDAPGTKEVSETFSIGTEGKAGVYDGWAHLEAVFPVNVKVRSDTVFFSATCTGSGPDGASQGVAPEVKDDCVSFDPDKTSAYSERNVWKIGDGSRVLFTFGVDKTEAENAAAIIRKYRMSKSCFVGKPRPTFHYMLSGDSAPAGPFAGESCKPVNPLSAEVTQMKTGWVLRDGGKALVGFAERKSEAERALAIIRQYGFTHICVMATGKVDYLYLRK